MNKSRVSNHERFMRLALRLAKRGEGFTNPNPLVGAVVVKDGKVLAQGYHKAAGLAHAEVVALDKAGPAACGGTLYVTLEPCCHFGRSAPCVDRIVSSAIKEVVFAMYDPNPLNNGRGKQFLRRHGIKVLSGILEEEAKKINRIFVKYITTKTPFVTVKIAQSLDGKIATQSGDARWISSPASRRLAHKLRSCADAVLVGVNTVLKDNPLLSCRLNGCLHKKQPKKVIVDSRLRLRPDLKIFSPRSPAQVIIATTKLAPKSKILYFKDRGAQVIVARDEEKRVDLRDLLRKLAGQGISHILIEGGGEIIASALKKRLVDRLVVLVSSKIIGGRDAPTAVEGRGIDRIRQAAKLEDMKVKRVGPDLIIEGRPV
ncbi:MAG: bifunctional diaminohydroxyphosphoribosylaminopyrimidine deaminase/5-amino-6-(5-phosphoribosylamino)uracil reductase RibD [Candidatus Omnitrophica bacterium]|nr:bifunctional diaminohydroxyphosphoribosylaminopyrimidine deaminase/5-amino-6-(5-phosphoribosylamino)uracil reductase RibD [Candidatus Omnitrophota bacterium]